jgi:transcriptional regulator NrdR family protein
MTYVIRSSGKKEEFDAEKLISSIMAAASEAGIRDDAGLQEIIDSASSNTISYANNRQEVQTKTLKDMILSQIIRIGIQIAIQKFGANASKENVISELINAGLDMSKSSRSSASSDALSEILGTLMQGDSRANSSSDILSDLLDAGLQMSNKSSRSNEPNDILSQLLGAGMQKSSRASASNDDLENIIKTGMKLANAWMRYNR